MKAEPVGVRGAMAFGLKAIAKALYEHGCIETTWQDGPTDGLGAMVGAWRCADEAERLGCDLRDLDLMKEIGSCRHAGRCLSWIPVRARATKQ